MTKTRTNIAAIFIVLTIAVAPAMAQQPMKLILNPQVGVNISKLSTDPDFGENKYRAGYEFGGYIRYGNRLFIQPGVFWHRMSVKLETFQTIENERSFENDISAIQVPALIGVNLVGNDMINLRIAGGGVVAFVTSVNSNPLYTKDDIAKTRWGLRGSVGVDVLFLTGDIGYDYGLTNFFTDRVMSDAKIRSYFFNVGVKF